MGFMTKYFWPLVGGSAVLAAVSLAFNAGVPAALAGVVFGGLLMWGEVQRAPAPTED